jgi:Skp family chaperone for outer membrane proteins
MKKIIVVLAGLALFANSFAQGKVAFLDTQKALDTMVFRANQLKEIQQLQMIAEKDFISRNEAIQKAMSDIKPDWSASTKKYEEGRIGRMQEQLEYDAQAMEKQLQQMSAEAGQKVNKRVTEAVAKVCKAKGIAYAIDKNQLLYESGGIDITTDVINEIISAEKTEGLR